MNVLIITNQARSLVNFWSVLLARLQEEGHTVLCCVPDEGDRTAEDALKALGARIRHYPLDRKGLNPLRDSKTVLALYQLFREEKPDVVYASTIKPVIYALPVAALAGINRRFAMITGLGYMFEADSTVKKALTCLAAALYRTSLSFSKAVFFQNADDVRTFKEWHCLPRRTQVVLTKGTGVDTTRFALAPHPPQTTFLLVGRLLEAKGLYEYAEAARILKQRYPEARFQILGPPEEARGGVPLATLHEWEHEGILEYLGETRDVRPYLAQATVVVLPSWREGMPCSLMEAMSTGRALVATDVPGCREVVVDGQNGFLVPPHAPQRLAAAMERFLNETGLAERMGLEGRRLAESELDARKAADHILQVMDLVS